MKPLKLPGDLCRRCVEYISRDLDGDLAEFERVLLRAHLSSCAACRATQRQLSTQTAVLRAAPLEPIPQPVALPSRGRLALNRFSAAAAAVAVAAVGLVSLVGIAHVGGDVSARRSLPAGAIESRDILVKKGRLTAMQLKWLSRAPRPVTRTDFKPF